MSAMTAGKWLLGVAGVAAIAAVIAAVTLEPPHVQRELRLDTQRAGDLSALSRAINEYSKRHDALPSSLEALAAEPGLGSMHTDPETGIAYAYEITGKRSFRLCANFARESKAPSRHFAQFEWAHGAGRHCFDRNVKDSARQEPAGGK